MRKTLILSTFIFSILLTMLWSPIVVTINILGIDIPVIGLVKYGYSYYENIVATTSIAVSVLSGLTLISTAYLSHKIEENE